MQSKVLIQKRCAYLNYVLGRVFRKEIVGASVKAYSSW